MNSTWLVVADNSRVRIFSMETRTGPIQEIESIVHTEARLREQNMTSDLPGRASSNSSGAGHSYEGETSPKEQENINFAKQVAKELDAARKNNKFKQIALVAAPGFLGNIRNQLSPQTEKLICFELAKNLAHLDAADIRSHLPERIPGL